MISWKNIDNQQSAIRLRHDYAKYGFVQAYYALMTDFGKTLAAHTPHFHSITKQIRRLEMRRLTMVGIPGFEPGMTGPESVVLPLHHIPMPFQSSFIADCVCKGTYFFLIDNISADFFLKKLKLTCHCHDFTINQCTFA